MTRAPLSDAEKARRFDALVGSPIPCAPHFADWENARRPLECSIATMRARMSALESGLVTRDRIIAGLLGLVALLAAALWKAAPSGL